VYLKQKSAITQQHLGDVMLRNVTIYHFAVLDARHLAITLLYKLRFKKY